MLINLTLRLDFFIYRDKVFLIQQNIENLKNKYDSESAAGIFIG